MRTCLIKTGSSGQARARGTMLARGLRQSLRSQACNARNALRTPQAPLRRKLCSAAAEGAAKEEGLLAKGQVDSGFFQGTALFAGVMFGAQASSEEQRATALDGLVGWYRTMGVSSNITDRQVRALTPLPPQLTRLAPRGGGVSPHTTTTHARVACRAAHRGLYAQERRGGGERCDGVSRLLLYFLDDRRRAGGGLFGARADGHDAHRAVHGRLLRRLRHHLALSRRLLHGARPDV